MLQLATDCLSGFREHGPALGVGIIVGFLLGLAAPFAGALVSFGPLLSILLCLAPCIFPLWLFRRDGSSNAGAPAISSLSSLAEAEDNGPPHSP